ncbi:MAG TPA: 2Fe-2S iron-sulfur cluster-binding protein [Anaerolineaceae bacterium]|nr:2Fe-2S iron-sulfur cluster-binding protein [Anaerolineaceae bacterium]
MSNIRWKVTFQIYRAKGDGPVHFDTFFLDVDPDEYVLDGVERLWAFHDRSLCYRHACHHSTCGACGMRVNGVEKLTCITPIREVTTDGGTLRIEPLRNFPVVSDLAVDMGSLYLRMDQVHAKSVLPVTEAEIEKSPRDWSAEDQQYIRLSDCIECGLCISACPISATDADYLGPAVLAGAQQTGLSKDPALVEIVDSEDGVWRCHSAYECTAVCPSFVDPARRIMNLRRQVLGQRWQGLFNRKGAQNLAVEEVTR